MIASWKIFALVGGVALAGAVGAACTVTTNSGDDAGNIFDDDAGDNGDTSTTQDTGTTPPACATETFPDGGSTALSLDPPDSGITTCTTCMLASCCTQLTACFQDPSGDCQALEDCANLCIQADPSDAGGCGSDCAGLYPDAVPLHTAWSNCLDTSCASACP